MPEWWPKLSHLSSVSNYMYILIKKATYSVFTMYSHVSASTI